MTIHNVKRTAEQVGDIVRRQREMLGLTQEEIKGISSSLIGQIERGVAPPGGRAGPRVAFMRALGWPPDALERIANGEDPEDFDPHGLPLRAMPADLDVSDPPLLEEVAQRVTALEARFDRVEELLGDLER